MVEYAGRTCIKLITTAASKSDAESQCQALSDESRLVTIKNGFEQKAIEEFLKDNSVAEDVYVGATYTTNQWLWSDGSPVFTTCKRYNLHGKFLMDNLTLMFLQYQTNHRV